MRSIIALMVTSMAASVTAAGDVWWRRQVTTSHDVDDDVDGDFG